MNLVPAGTIKARRFMVRRAVLSGVYCIRFQFELVVLEGVLAEVTEVLEGINRQRVSA